MAGQAVVGALRVNLGLNSAQFEKGMKRSRGSLKRFGSIATRAMKVAGAGIAAAFAAASIAIKSFLGDADKLAKMSQSIGVSVEELSALRHAAELSGTSLESLGKSYKKLSQNLLQVAQGSGLEARRAFEALDVQILKSDGTLRDSGEVLRDIANRFSRMEDGATKTALAMALFGRAGGDLIPLLNQGRDGIKQMTDEAAELGLVIDTNTAKAAERFNDNMTRVKATMQGFRNELSKATLPTLEALGKRFIQVAKDSENFKAAAQFMAKILAFVGEQALKLIGGLRSLGAEMSALAEAAKLLAQGDFAGASDAFNAGMQRSVEITRETRAEVKKLRNEIAIGNKLGPGAYDLDSSFDRKSFLAPAKDDAGQLKITFDAVEESVKKAKVSADKLTDAEKLALEKAKEMQAVWSSIGDGIAGLIKGTSDWRDVLGDVLGQVSQIFLSRAGGGGLGGGGGPIGGIVSSLIGGLGGFKQGGTFRVGGSGGADSQVVAFKATPSETVSVRTPQQSAMSEGGGVAKIVLEAVEGGAFELRVREVSGPVAVDASRALITQNEKSRARGRLTGAVTA